MGKTPIVWQEAYDKYGKGTFGYGYTPPHLDKHTIVQMWEGWPGTARVSDLAAKKFPMIRSYDWYLDNGEDNDWMQRYRVDPVDGLNGEAATYIKGGEACLWGEHIDQTNLFSRAYPRLSAVAERLWSPEEVAESGRRPSEFMKCVLVFYTRIFLQYLVSIQPRTSPVMFEEGSRGGAAGRAAGR